MKLDAAKIPDDDNYITPNVDGHSISKFLYLKKCWGMAPADCHSSDASFAHLAYGMRGQVLGETDGRGNHGELWVELCSTVEGEGPEGMWLGRVCNEGRCSKKHGSFEGEIVKGLQKRGRQADH